MTLGGFGFNMGKINKVFRPVRFNSDAFERSERENAKRQRRLARTMRRSEKEIYLETVRFYPEKTEKAS